MTWLSCEVWSFVGIFTVSSTPFCENYIVFYHLYGKYTLQICVWEGIIVEDEEIEHHRWRCSRSAGHHMTWFLTVSTSIATHIWTNQNTEFSTLSPHTFLWLVKQTQHSTALSLREALRKRQGSGGRGTEDWSFITYIVVGMWMNVKQLSVTWTASWGNILRDKNFLNICYVFMKRLTE